jgi:hypothetical protein
MSSEKMSSERSYLLEIERLCRLFVNYKTDGETEDFKKQIRFTLNAIDDARIQNQRIKEARRRK